MVLCEQPVRRVLNRKRLLLSRYTDFIEDYLDISRGDMLVKMGDTLQVTKAFDAMLCWLSEQPLDPGWKYLIKQSARIVRALISRYNFC